MKDYLKDCLYGYHWDPAKALVRAIEARLISRLDFKEPILDLGCGDGTFISVLSYKPNIVGLDFKFNNLTQARDKKLYNNLMVCDARALVFKNASFNSLILNSFLEHINGLDLEKVLSEVNRILNVTGKVVITVNNSSFGRADPLIMLLDLFRLSRIKIKYQKYINRRLALNSLKDLPYWLELFKKNKFKVIASQYYLSLGAERNFFIWTHIQFLGIGKINLGSFIRSASKILCYFKINFHRKIIAYLFGKFLRKAYLVDGNNGSCLLFILEKER